MPRRSAWLILVTAVMALAATVYLNREPLLRAAIAYRIYHADIFISPPTPGESRFRRLYSDAQFYWDFAEIRLAREKRLKEVNPVLHPLVKQITSAQTAGKDMQYSMYIYREIRWLLNFTPDLKATWMDVAALCRSLSEPERQKRAADQQPDGSWTDGINIWYLELYYSVDRIEGCVGDPKYPLAFLDHINSPEELRAQLDDDLYDNFTQTGIFNREKLDETFSPLARLIFKRKQTGCYAFHPELGEALRRFVNHWQNPITGCWGQWLVDRQGRIWKMDDMGMTFHVVSDMHGQVDHLDQVAKRLLELVDVDFPAGLRFNGHFFSVLNVKPRLALLFTTRVRRCGSWLPGFSAETLTEISKPVLSSFADHVSERLRPALLVLACAVFVVMLIVCANLSNLLLARMATRQKEMTIRASLGARRDRLIRQTFTESLVLSSCAAVIGLVLAVWGMRAITHLTNLDIPLLASVRIDFGALAFTVAIAALTGLIFGLIPALQAPAAALHDFLKSAARGSSRPKNHAWISDSLVVSEIAFACLLLGGSGLLIRSFIRLLDANIGFKPENATALRVDPSPRYSSRAQRNTYFDEVLRAVRALPGIEAAGLTDVLPLGGD